VTLEDGGYATAEPLRLPDPALLFEARATRLRALAAGHATADWLVLLSRVAEGQRAASRDVGVRPAPPAHAGSPLAYDAVARDEAWRRMLEVVLSAARAAELPAETVRAIDELGAANPSGLEAAAGEVLAGSVPVERLAQAPFVGAALQAWFCKLAARVDPSALGRGGSACPVCRSPPIAGIVQRTSRLRYLSCSLCAAEWNVPRVQCVICGAEAGLEYLHVEGDEGVKAEACGACRAYVKLIDEERRPGAEAAADDAATLALDILMGEEGWHRAGVNLYWSAGVPGRR
jgi:FdhE protein